MKREAPQITSGITVFARVVLYLVGLAALGVLVILIPELVREESVGKPANTLLTVAFFGTMYTLATPFFIALYQTHKLLDFIDKKAIFTRQSIRALQNIKRCAILFSILVIIATVSGISIAKSIDPKEDVTFMVPIGLIVTFVSTVLAIFIAVLQKLLTEAVSLKSENDLII